MLTHSRTKNHNGRWEHDDYDDAGDVHNIFNSEVVTRLYTFLNEVCFTHRGEGNRPIDGYGLYIVEQHI